jgi:hypothetical protein
VCWPCYVTLNTEARVRMDSEALRLQREWGVCPVSLGDHAMRPSGSAERGDILTVTRVVVQCKDCGQQEKVPMGPTMKSAVRAGLIRLV